MSDYPNNKHMVLTSYQKTCINTYKNIYIDQSTSPMFIVFGVNDLKFKIRFFFSKKIKVISN